MLGRLRMSIDECEESFKMLCRTIYPLHKGRDDQFNSDVLAGAMKDMVRRKVGHAGPVFIAEVNSDCKV